MPVVKTETLGWKSLSVFGMDFGTVGETVEEEFDIAPDGRLKILFCLRHPVLPKTIPPELKGIA